MTAERNTLDNVHAALGYKYLSRAWAKAEILFGLGAAGIGMLLGFWAVSRQAVQLPWVGAALLLFVLGWYLALAGTRSHLYRSMNDLTVLLLEEIRRVRAVARRDPPGPRGVPPANARRQSSRDHKQ